MILILYIVSFNRKTRKCFTLSDGTHLPQGTLIAVPMAMLSTDPDLLDDPETSDGTKSLWKLRVVPPTMQSGPLPP